MLEPQSIFAWILIGAIAGWLAGLLVKGYGFGLIGNIVSASSVRASRGCWRLRLAFDTQSFAGNIVAALLGALVLLLLVGLVRRARLSASAAMKLFECQNCGNPLYFENN